MASYTMQLREILEHYSQDDIDGKKINEIIEIGRPHLFDFNYPIFDEAYRNVFETNFIKNFYMREIGFETEGLFKFRLETWLQINMPFYNKLYESELLQFNPLESYNLKTTYEKKNDTMQDDDKTVSQSNTNLNVESGSNSVTENNTNTVNRNESTIKSQNDDKSKTNNVGVIASESSSINEESKVDLTSTNEINSETIRDNEQVSENEEKTNHFNRILKSNNPDSRLSITPNEDGSGTIQYAHEIQENKDNVKVENDGKITNKDDEQTNVLDTVTSSNDGTSKSEIEKNSDSTTTGSETERLTSSASDTFNGTVTDTETNRLNGQNNKTVNDSGTLNISDKVLSKKNDIEEYVEEKVGSIGVKTYSEMITEYRESLIRVEQRLFDEMNELFMLVY